MPDLDYGYIITIDKNATSDPAHVPTNQWQRKIAAGKFQAIPGETDDTYEVKDADRDCKIRLVQKLGGTRTFSNELQVTSDAPGKSPSGYIGVHLKNTYQIKFYYDCMVSADVYTKQNEGDPWVFYESIPAGTNSYWFETAPGYYAIESSNITRCSFGKRQNGGSGTHSFCEFELLEESDFSNVTDLSYFFNGCKYWNQASLDWLDIGHVTSLEWAFANTEKFTGTVGFQTSSVTSFRGCWEQLNPSKDVGVNPDLSTWDTSKAKNFDYMFRSRPLFNNSSITGWDTSSATSMKGMFIDATIFNQDLTGWCVEKIPTEPAPGSPVDHFSQNSALSNSNKPNWGAPC